MKKSSLYYSENAVKKALAVASAFSYILSEQNAYIHIKNLGKDRE